MTYIKGFTFGFMAPRGAFMKETAKKSLYEMKQRTGCTTVILAIAALQDTAQSIHIDYRGEHIVGDDELVDMIYYAQSMGLEVILKPLVNVADGTWRAHIKFFDHDVPCEPKWSEWFSSYQAYQEHYAKIAETTGCSMYIVGCEMVQTTHRDNDWRRIIASVRKHYKGLVSYNADKYQEDRITWWDAVDVISSSGYYPINEWDQNISRIKQVVLAHNKPFFFAEAGCMNVEGAAKIPNDWSHPGEISDEEQSSYYDSMFNTVKGHDFIQGFGLWDWSWNVLEDSCDFNLKGYNVYKRPSEKIIKTYFDSI